MRNCSASGMFVFKNIPSCMELWGNYSYGFMIDTHRQTENIIKISHGLKL